MRRAPPPAGRALTALRRALPAAVLAVVLAAVWSGCGGEAGTGDGEDAGVRPETAATPRPPGPSPDAPEGTRRMAARLAALWDGAPLEARPYDNAARARALRAAPTPEGARGRFLRGLELGTELLRAGDTDAALAEFRALERMLAGVPGGAGRVAEPLGLVRDRIATAHLHRAFLDGCVRPGGAGACLVPPPSPGAAAGPAGAGAEGRAPPEAGVRERARAAAEAYASVLALDPGDVLARWLLNVSGMLGGAWPSGVPAAHRIPLAAFRSEASVGRFRDVAPALGVDVRGHAGGGALEDFDGDGDLDLLASSQGLRDPLRFFRNEGDGAFTDRSRAAGLAGLTGGLNLKQADYDDDGDVDVLVLRGGWYPVGHPNSLLRNRGDGTFEDATEEAGLLSSHPTQTADWADYDGDGDLDLFVGNESETRGREPRRHPCALYRNRGDGTFEEVAAEAGVDVVGFVKAVVWGDIDNDGRPDLYVSRFDEPNILFRNEGPGPDGAWRFRDVTDRAGVAAPVKSFPAWFWDYDNDGWLDLFVSGYFLRPAGAAAEYAGDPRAAGAVFPRLYRNRGDGTFEDVAGAAGLHRALTTMGSNHGDLDGDGWPDLYAGTGDPDLRSRLPNRAFRNVEGGRFADVTTAAGVGHVGKGHAVSFGDVDGDGDQDVHAVIGGAYESDLGRNVLFENPGHGNAWVTLRLEGVEANRSAIGARIRVVAATPDGSREIHALAGTGGSFGANSLQQEIGLGSATRIRLLEVTWPGSGRVQRAEDLAVRRAYRLREGSPPEPVTVPAFPLPSPP